ncbi:hypothetical protein ID866_3516 [Astraeus odoratus]|nr:hypothetical protein ID866_3516 [Astraeus odoratus]
MSKKKPTKPPILSEARDLVPLGPRQVQAKYQGKRDENGLKPSTSRALVLRNGKYGARGAGELVLAGKMSGREKLDLLAEDLVQQKTRSAIMSPLKLEKCIRIADSQFNAYLDDIATLKDPELFGDKLKEEIAARTPYSSTQGIQDALSNTSYVAVHNAYMMASGWRIVLDTLRSLEKSGMKDETAHIQLQKDGGLRSRYLVLCDIINVLVDLGQMQFSVLATTAPHYCRYFKAAENAGEGEPEITFDWSGIKDACKSFMDSIIIELCFPKAPYSKRILLEILHDAVDESPREAKRFPQKMWDAMGDLSVTLELQELLDRPLLGSEGERLKALPRKMPERFELWIDAQIYSKQASEMYENFRDVINPLERTKNQSVLDQMWKMIDLVNLIVSFFINPIPTKNTQNCLSVSSVSMETLWQLDDAFHRIPQWSAFYTPNIQTLGYESDDDDIAVSLIKNRNTSKKRIKKPQKKLLAITDGRVDENDSNDSMPELRSVSDSSEESDTDCDDYNGEEEVYEGYEDEDNGDDDDETEYDSEQEEAYRDWLREAMDAAMAIPEFFDSKANVPEFEAMAEERKENPFLKLLSSLRGINTQHATTRTEPRKGIFGAKSQATKAVGKVTPAFKIDFSNVDTDDLPPLQPLTTPRKKRLPKLYAPKAVTTDAPSALPGTLYYCSVQPTLDDANTASPARVDQRATVEDVEDEDDAASTTSKKKKKKKPKKKRTGTRELGTLLEDTPTTNVPIPVLSPVSRSPPQSPQIKSAAPNASVASPSYASTTSLPIGQTTTKSGHAYLQEMEGPKEKIKSRPDHASIFSDKKGFLSKISGKTKEKETPTQKKDNTKVNKKPPLLLRLKRKSFGYIHQLLDTSEKKQGSLKWENFLKVMRDMGFSYDPSTAGSSVRFDPPSKGDRSITFHKPHPDPTLHPNHLREFGKKLKNYYGWSEDDLL